MLCTLKNTDIVISSYSESNVSFIKEKAKNKRKHFNFEIHQNQRLLAKFWYLAIFEVAYIFGHTYKCKFILKSKLNNDKPIKVLNNAHNTNNMVTEL